MKEGFSIAGRYFLTCRDQDGKFLWRDSIENTLTIVGLTDILSAACNQGTQRTWYMGIIKSTSFDEITQDDTMASHAGWLEETDYSGATRKQWTPLAVSTAVCRNTSGIQFQASVALIIKGFFITSDSAKDGVSGILLSAGEFTTARTIPAGASLTVNYILRAAGGT